MVFWSTQHVVLVDQNVVLDDQNVVLVDQDDVLSCFLFFFPALLREPEKWPVTPLPRYREGGRGGVTGVTAQAIKKTASIVWVRM